MKLAELEAKFLKIIDERTHQYVDQLAEADGVMFLCPKCFTTNGGTVGTHSVICWSPKVPQTHGPMPGRWNMNGSGLGDLTLTAGSSSIQLVGGCNAHFWIQKGEITGLT